MNIVLAGATGLTGGLVLNRLLNQDGVSQVISIGRRSTGVDHPKLREIRWDGQSPLPEIHANAFICCLGTTRKKAGSAAAFRQVDLDLPLTLAHALKKQGCETMVVVSAMGADAGSMLLYPQTKGELEEKLERVGFRSLALLRPSLIAGDRREWRPLERVAERLFSAIKPVLVGRLENYRSIKAEQIADAIVKLVIKPRSGVNVYLSESIKRV